MFTFTCIINVVLLNSTVHVCPLQVHVLYMNSYMYVHVHVDVHVHVHICNIPTVCLTEPFVYCLYRTFKGGGGGALPQKGVPTSSLPDDTVPEGSGGRKVSAYFKQIMFRNRSGTSQSLQNIQVSSKTLMTELHNAPLDEQHSKYTEGFRFDQLHVHMYTYMCMYM